MYLVALAAVARTPMAHMRCDTAAWCAVRLCSRLSCAGRRGSRWRRVITGSQCRHPQLAAEYRVLPLVRQGMHWDCWCGATRNLHSLTHPSWIAGLLDCWIAGLLDCLVAWHAQLWTTGPCDLLSALTVAGLRDHDARARGLPVDLLLHHAWR